MHQRLALDAPATLTLYTGSVNDVAGFAADPARLEANTPKSPARVVLVDSSELAWQKARYRQHGDLITPVDAVLVGMPSLQEWLWQRLRGTTTASGGNVSQDARSMARVH